MTFEEYLSSKKIDASRFKKSEAAQFEEWQTVFEQMHPESFTAQKLFLINPLRRRFPMKDEIVKAERKPQMKPKILPKPKK